MAWMQLKFSTDQQHVDLISDWLTELGAVSMTYQDAHDDPILEPLPGETPLWQDLIVSALFDAAINTGELMKVIAEGPFQSNIINPMFEQLEDKDWVRAWMDDFKPMQFGQRLWIVPSWHAPPDPSAVNILLDPGLAFGTGTHPTTALCLEWLDQADVAGKEVLDFGCGSGILAIAAAKLAAKSVVAVDIDPQAIVATKDNMQRNGLADDAINSCLSSRYQAGLYDLVLANILAGPLCQLAETLASQVKQGGDIVLSGLLAEQAEEISNHYEKWFNMSRAVGKDDWVRLHGVKR
ncbi:MAG: 50S ribosomal protein L11 methyltransferase [Kangiellaceae bacterium]|jgi:ribosomal protein L11 methyltransferase|nr:50S ribosomal protein L11 methyltransferase [Kangiellaceae bacterium]